MSGSRKKLIEFFQQQSAFSMKYSPLYQRLFAEVATWLEVDPDEATAKWIVDASSQRSELEASLLLMAGMHRDVLLGSSGTDDLAKFYPTRTGSDALPPHKKELSTVFRNAVTARKESLEDVIQNQTVQTNETARGIFWLLPTLLTGWKAANLVDLGASAGLNLVAEQRRYTLLDDQTNKDNDPVSIGLADDNQFHVLCKPNNMRRLLQKTSIPRIVSRHGCDLKPFLLETEEDRATLESFVWPDQLDRIARLEEGMAAFMKVREDQEVQILPANLPNDLPAFLRGLNLRNDIPTIIYNTYMTKYLENEGQDLELHIASWAKEEDREVLWLQAEPPRFGMPEHPRGLHWCAWTVDLWQYQKSASKDDHLRWQIAWTHPHGTQVEWIEDEFQDFVQFFQFQ